MAGGRRRDVRVAMLTRLIAISPTIRVGSISDEATDQHSGTFLSEAMRLSRKLSLHSSRLHAGSDTVGTMGRLAPAITPCGCSYSLGVPECGDELATSMGCLGMLWARPETSSRMPGTIPSETGAVARGRRKPSLLGSVEALSQNWGGLTGPSGAGVHVGDLHDPETAPIRFHADLHAGSGWDRNIACTLEDREVEKGIRNRAVQRTKPNFLSRLNQLTRAVPIIASPLQRSTSVRLPRASGGKWDRTPRPL